MKCSKCGREIPDDSNYCPYCGSRVGVRWEEFQVEAEALVAKVKQLLREGNVRRIVVRSPEGKTLLEIPVTIGAIGALLAPYLAALGSIAAMVSNCTIAVERRE
ncbi:MAG TPA: DUF4342 domain-containing protein [Candidatus Bathyarchaeota archaeon]|nr:DUF4342 domain-containing protein [Candidatus Bathyarchaeota archaeon]